MARHLLRTASTIVVGLAVTVAAAVAAILISRFRPTSSHLELVIEVWSRVWLAVAGVDLHVVGEENVDPRTSYVVVANHASALDIMACFRAVPLPIRYLAKKELFRIPLLASAMRAIDIIEVDRQARTPVREQINRQVEELVASGRSVIIYPEGTRSRDGSLGQFKKGAFTIAARSGLPILPVTIHGTHEAWSPGSMLVRGGPVTVAIDPPVETSGMVPGDATELRTRVHSVIEKRLEWLSQS